jgi:hypothetical protein
LLAVAYSEARLDLSKLDRDIKAATKKIERAAKQIERKLKVKVDLDTKAAETKLRNFERTVERTRRRIEARAATLDIRVADPTAQAAAAGRDARTAAERGFGRSGLEASVTLDTSRFDAAYRRVTERLQRLNARRYRIEVDIDYDEDAFARLQDAIVGANESRRLRIAVDFDVDTAAATAEVARAREQFEALLAGADGLDRTIDIDVRQDGTSEVLGELGVLSAALTALPKRVDIDVSLDLDPSALATITAARAGLGKLDVDARDAAKGLARTVDDLAALAARLGEVTASVDGLGDWLTQDLPETTTPDVDLDTDRFDTRLAEVQARLSALTTRAARLTFDLDGADAVVDAAAIRAEIEALLDDVVTVAMRSQGDEELLVRLATVDAAARRLDGFTIKLGTEVVNFPETLTELETLDGFAAGRRRRELEWRARLTGGPAVIAEAAAVTAAVEAVPDDVVIRYSVKIDEFFDASNARIAAKAAERAAAVEEATRTRIEAASLRSRAVAQAKRTEQYRKFAAEAERVAIAAANKADANLADRELRLEANRTRAIADRRARNLQQLERGNVALLRVAKRADDQLDDLLRQNRIGDRQLRITARFEGLAQRVAELAPYNRALDDLERRRRVDVDTVSFTRALRTIARDLTPVRRLLDERGRRGSVDLFDFGDSLGRAQRLFRSLPLLAEAAFSRVRRAGQGGGVDFTDVADRANRFFRSLPILAGAAFNRLRRFRIAGQGSGLDFGDATRQAQRFFRSLPVLAAASAQRVRPLLRRAFDAAGVAAVEVRLDARGFFRNAAAVMVQKLALSRDIDINIDVDRRGVGRAGLGRLVGAAARGVGSLVTLAGKGASAVLGAFGETASGISSSFTKAFSGVGEQVTQLASTFGQVASKLGKVLGPVLAVVLPVAIVTAVAGLVTAIVGAITLLVGPISAALGALIGGAVAFIVSSAIAAVPVALLPALAVILGPAKDQVIAQLKPLKDELIEAFAPTTDLIVNRIVPAFTAVASKLLPIVADVSESFITPIADSLLRLVTNPALTEAITTLAAPIGEGLASFVDTLDRLLPAFNEITATIGQPITDALNAIVEGMALVGLAFKDDIAGAFDVITDLFTDLTPVLGALGPVLEPTIRLLARLIEVFSNAALQVEAQVGPIGDVFDRLTARLPELQDGFAAAALLALKIVDALTASIPVINFLLQATTAWIGLLSIIAGGLIAPITSALGAAFGVLELGLTQIARFASGILAPIFDFLGFDGIADKVREGAESFDGFRENVNRARSATQDLSGSLIEGGASLAAGSVSIGQYAAAADEMADSSEAAAARQRLLDEQLRRGQITFSDYIAETGRASRATQLMAGVVDDLIKRLDEGALSVSNFAEKFRREIGSAADYVTEIEEEVDKGAERVTAAALRSASRVERDASRRLRDLQRQTRRDEENITRAAEDYQEAIRNAAELRAKAPEQYEWGAFNFNQVLAEDARKRQEEYDRQIRDAERAIQDRARALEDAKLGLEDNRLAISDALEDRQDRAADRAAEQAEKLADATVGKADAVVKRSIDIRSAISQEVKKIGDEAEKALTLLEIRSLGRDFAPMAKFLEGLDPELVRSAVDQLGGVGSAAFNAQAEKLNEAADKFNGTLEESFAQARLSLEEERLRLDRIKMLLDLGLEDLVASLEGFSAEDFNNEIDSITAQGGVIALGVMNEAAATLRKEEEALKAEARRYGQTLSDGVREGYNLAFSKEGLSAFPAFDEAVGGATGGLGPDDLANRNRQRGAAIGEQVLGGVLSVLGRTDGGVSSAISDLFGTVNYERFAVAGQDSAEKFYDGLESALRNNVNRTFVVAALGSMLVTLRLNGERFGEVGVALGGALTEGVEAGVVDSAGRVYETIRLLGDGIDTSVNEKAFSDAGEALAEATLDGMVAGFNGPSRQVALGALGTMRIAALLQAEDWRSAGASLGVALGEGVAVGIQLQAPAVVNAAATLALLVTTIIRSAFQISSPSRVMAAIGADVTRGLAVGIASTDVAERAAADSAAAVIAAAEAAALGSTASVEQPFFDAGAALGRAVGDGVQAGLEGGLGSTLDALGGLGGPGSTTLTRQVAELILAGVGSSGIGSGVGATLPASVNAVAATPQPVQAQPVVQRGATPQVPQVVEQTTINVYGVSDGPEAAAEIARRQRDQRFLRGRQ